MPYIYDYLSSMKNKYSPLCLWTEVAETKEYCKKLEMTTLLINPAVKKITSSASRLRSLNVEIHLQIILILF
jgi:hypothetical protein